MSDNPTSVRLPSEVRDRLASRAAANGRSVNNEIIMILKGVLQPSPATIVIRECHGPLGKFFTAALGESPYHFISAECEDEVYAAVIRQISALGRAIADLRIEHRIEILE